MAFWELNFLSIHHLKYRQAPVCSGLVEIFSPEEKTGATVQVLRQLIASFYMWKLGFNPREVHVGLVLDRVVLR
jgi:hypothetical protein